VSSSHLILAAILAAMLVSIVLMQVNHRLASPVLQIVDRWLRWIVFALGSAQICVEYELIDRPFWALATAFFIVWFLVVSLYDWLAITAHSLSPLPLFPRYVVNASGDEWPVQPRLLQMREWLRAQGFRQVQALKAEIGGGILLRTSIYQDAQAMLRVQVSFLPQASGAISVCYAVSSVLADGSRYLTDNLYIPFAGFYPENWYVERLPWRRSLPRLIERHRGRLGRVATPAVPFETDPLTDLNAVQRELDQLNTELGFLYPQAQREDFGKFTAAGRYRVWKEIWMLNYLGRAARYE
jgi:hypothetical protein